jgi:hypothetical protein
MKFDMAGGVTSIDVDKEKNERKRFQFMGHRKGGRVTACKLPVDARRGCKSMKVQDSLA